MKRFLSLLVGLLILSLLSGCLLQPFGKGGSKFKPAPPGTLSTTPPWTSRKGSLDQG